MSWRVSSTVLECQCHTHPHAHHARGEALFEHNALCWIVLGFVRESKGNKLSDKEKTLQSPHFCFCFLSIKSSGSFDCCLVCFGLAEDHLT